MISYEEDWVFLLLLKRKGSVARRAAYFALPCALLSFLIVLMNKAQPISVDGHEINGQTFGMTQLTKSQLWGASTAFLAMLLGFRTNQAMTRFWEGTGLLHQLRGEWFDSISCCVTFSHIAVGTKKAEVMAFRHALVRLMSLCHGSALEEIAGGCAGELSTIDPFGLDTKTLCYLNDCKHTYNFNRVEALLHITQTLITRSLDEGILKIPPPILSRVYQTLSRGFVNLLNAKKIADTKFPFPYAQLICILLVINMVTTPLLISSIIPSLCWAPVFSFVPMFAMASVNLISIELENPYGNDDNDLPLHHFQGEMNKCLMMLLHPSADIVAGIAEERCIFDYEELARQFHGDGDQIVNWNDDRRETKRLSSFAQSSAPGLLQRQSSKLRGYGFSSTSREDCGIEMSRHNSLSAAVKHIVSSSVQSGPLLKSISDSELNYRLSREVDEISDCDEVAVASQAKAPQIGGTAEANTAIRVPLDEKGVLLPELADDKQIQELHRSLRALKEFTNSLTFVIESMISRRENIVPAPTVSNEASQISVDVGLHIKAACHRFVEDAVPTQEPAPRGVEKRLPNPQVLEPRARDAIIII